MSEATVLMTLSPRDFDAVLFDLDGVLTRTAQVHAAAWKQAFDELLERWSKQTGERFAPFEINPDYGRHVDGKPRLDGVAAFLQSRGVTLPPGAADDEPGTASVHALGKLKDGYFLERLERHGVEVYAPAVALVRELRAHDIKTAVVSSSNNCARVLQAAGIEALFDARVDGLDLGRLGLRGKPAPDAFLEGARRLGTAPLRSVVVEDAVAGVAAGRAGNFGSVVGVDRGGRSLALRQAGAAIVVTSLAQIKVADEPASAWSLLFEGFDAANEGTREALCTLGNGYFATRGTWPGTRADGVHYPGTYLAGGYNRLRSDIAGREVENEDLVNLPDWTHLRLQIDGERWIEPREQTIIAYRQRLDLRTGMLLRTLHFEDASGRRTTLNERRLVSMADMHRAAVELALTAENWSGRVGIESAIDGRVVNAGAALYRHFANKHLEFVSAGPAGDDGVCLVMRTSQSDVRIAQAARTLVFRDGATLDDVERRTIEEPGYIGQAFEVELRQGQSLLIEKLASLYTSRDHAISECSLEARRSVARAGRFDAVLAAHERAWHYLWTQFDVYVAPPDPGGLNILMLLRLNVLHLLQAVSMHSIGLDIGVPARGWTGEAYQGHVFWDELFILPFFNHRMPEVTRSLLMYRWRRLGEARAAAAAAGHRGAMFPWQSGSNGEEATQVRNFNARSKRWVPDHSRLQHHVGSAIAYNVWQYFQVTQDTEFLEFYGAELLLDIALFWSSMATFSDAKQRYEIRGVMGPDEFHEGYPDAAEPGLANNAYTNVMAVWVLRRGLDVLERLSSIRRAELVAGLGLGEAELARWDDISRRMVLPLRDDGIIDQFDGYSGLRELDWDDYRARYGNIQRLDLILEAEGDTPNRYKLSKQPDVLMLFYLFSADELRELFAQLGYPFAYETIPRNVAYYDQRTSHGSTLGRVVHSWVLARSDRPRSMQYFAEALQSDVNDIQQGTTAEGIHLGAMGGTVDLVQRVSTGIEVAGDVLRLNPRLPAELDRLEIRIRYRGHSLDLHLTRETLAVHGRDRGLAPIRIGFKDEVVEFAGDTTHVFSLGKST